MIKTPKELETYVSALHTAPDKPRIVVGTDATCCILQGAPAVAEAFETEIARRNMTDDIELVRSGCLGFCKIEPMVIIEDRNILYQRVKPQDVVEILDRTVDKGEVVERLLFLDPVYSERRAELNTLSFYEKQNRLILGAHEKIVPTSIDSYLANGGYSAAAKALTGYAPQEIIDEVKKAGLRGRGGGGFPTARKWQSCRDAESDDGIRYIMCNADEGNPGAYMDRSILEGNPHSVVEGMIIGSYAIGSGQGYVYVRVEYPLAVKQIGRAIEEAERLGFLGEDIFGSGHSFRLKVVRGAGAYVCGESTALMASIEGKVGRPRAKYVHTVEKGLRNKPSTLNNVETWATVTRIFQIGADEYGKVGTEASKGTKIFSLAGKITNTGLVEVPMGISLRNIIFDIGGGIPRDQTFKAVQTGGPSGGFIPADFLDIPVDFDELTKAGSMMGSGGLIVMDEDNCMVDMARCDTGFLKGESCGKCVACREGVARMSEVLDRICEGNGVLEDLDTLEELAEYLVDSSLCALGSSAANPVLTTLKHFRDEYLEHIEQRFCRAGICKSLFEFKVDPDACTGCGDCRKRCPTGAISGEDEAPHVIDTEICIKCGECYKACKFDAIAKAHVSEVVA